MLAPIAGPSRAIVCVIGPCCSAGGSFGCGTAFKRGWDSGDQSIHETAYVTLESGEMAGTFEGVLVEVEATVYLDLNCVHVLCRTAVMLGDETAGVWPVELDLVVQIAKGFANAARDAEIARTAEPIAQDEFGTCGGRECQ
jgi:hypothetical protein